MRSPFAADGPIVSSRGIESLVVAPEAGHHWSEWVAALVLFVTFAATGGLVGAVAGSVVVAVWARVGTPFALATAVVAMIAGMPGAVDPLSVTLLGVGVLAVLLAPAVTATNPATYAITVLFITALLGGLTWLLVYTQPLWLAATVLVGAGAIGVAGVSRYQRLRLGLLPDTDGTPRKARVTAPDRDGDHE